MHYSQEGFCLRDQSMSCTDQGVLLAFCTYLVFSIVLIYVRFVVSQRQHWHEGVKHVQLMSIRMPLMIPAYAILSLFVYIFPFYLPVVEIFEAVFEGYAIYCYFKMVLFAVGSEQRVRDMIRDSTATGCLCFKFPFWASLQADESCLLRIRLGFLQFLFLRPLFFLASALIEVLGETDDATGEQAPALESLKRLFAALAVLSLVITLPCIMRLFEVFRTTLQDLGLLRKVVFIKAFILLWVIENNIVNFYNNDKGLAAMLYSRRIFSTVVIIELCALSAALGDVFGAGPAMHQRLAELARREAPISYAYTDAADGPDDASLLRGGSAPAASSQSGSLVLSPVASKHVEEGEEGVVGTGVGATEYWPVRSGGGGGEIVVCEGSSEPRSSIDSSGAKTCSVSGRPVGEVSDESRTSSNVSNPSNASSSSRTAVGVNGGPASGDVSPHSRSSSDPPPSSSSADHTKGDLHSQTSDVRTLDTRDTVPIPTLHRKLPVLSACQMLLCVLSVWRYTFDAPSDAANASLVSSTPGLHHIQTSGSQGSQVLPSSSSSLNSVPV